MGLPMNSSQAALASAQARVSGDVETQNMLDLLAQAQLIRAPNLPNPDDSYAPAPLTVLARHRHHLDGQGLGQQEDPFHSSQQPMRLPTFRINQLQLLLVEVAIRARNLPQSVRR
ncbi:hypothetical protein LB503_012322 [Fusarium chuoi]|nr:hypothetical protein LB503_012322 [Fusarium chuoi]